MASVTIGTQFRSLQNKFQECISVKDFGAVGDGITDDSAALQAAILAATPGNVLFWPPGTYVVWQTLLFSSSGVKHFCEGGFATIRVRQNAPSGFAAATITASNQQFVGLAFNASANMPALSNSDQQTCVLFSPAGASLTDISFEGCLFSNSYRSGVRYYGPASLENIAIRSCKFQDMVDPTWSPVNYSRPCIGFGNMNSGYNIVVEGCSFRNFSGAGFSFYPGSGVAVTNVNQVIFANNTLDATGYQTSYTSIGCELLGVGSAVVSGNSFRNMRMGVSASLYGQLHSISGNTFDGMNSYGVELGLFKGVSITGNTFRNCANGVLHSSACENVTISSNTFVDIVPNAANTGWAYYATIFGGGTNNVNCAFNDNAVSNSTGVRLTAAINYSVCGNVLCAGANGSSIILIDGGARGGSVCNNSYTTAVDLPSGVAAISFGSGDVVAAGNTITSTTASINTGRAMVNSNGSALTNAQIANNIIRNFTIGLQTNFGAATSANTNNNVIENNISNCTLPLLATANDSVRARRIITSASPPTGGTYFVGDVCLAQNPVFPGALVGWQCTGDGTPGTWTPINRINPWNALIVGDADTTITPLVSQGLVMYTQPLTADRTITLDTTNAYTGCFYRVTRTAAATGAFNLNVGGLKALTAAGQWCDVAYNLGSFRLIASGSL